METITKNHNRSNCWVVESSPNEFIYKTFCTQGSGNTADEGADRARESGSCCGIVFHWASEAIPVKSLQRDCPNMNWITMMPMNPPDWEEPQGLGPMQRTTGNRVKLGMGEVVFSPEESTHQLVSQCQTALKICIKLQYMYPTRTGISQPKLYPESLSQNTQFQPKSVLVSFCQLDRN